MARSAIKKDMRYEEEIHGVDLGRMACVGSNWNRAGFGLHGGDWRKRDILGVFGGLTVLELISTVRILIPKALWSLWARE